jgi:hypothetical protein
MCTETTNAQESVAAAIKNPATTSSRGSLKERPPPKSRSHQPHDEVGIARTKRFVFQKKLATSYLMTPHFVSNDLLGRGSQPVGKWLL